MILGYYGYNEELAKNGIAFKFTKINPPWEARRTHNKEVIGKIVLHNLNVLEAILKWNKKNNITYYRFVMEFIHQYFDAVPIIDLPNWNQIQMRLQEIGEYILQNNIRLSTHPALNNILGSDKPNVVKSTIKRLNAHSILMDLMGLPANDFYCINTHVGSGIGGHDVALDRFINNFDKLYESTQKRLVVENDDKSGLFSIKKLMYLNEKRNIPICLDYLHHAFYPDDLSEKEALIAAASTWKNTPVVHIVSGILNENTAAKNPRKHADYLYERFEDYGIKLYGMIEANKSDKALLKYRENEI